MRIGPSAGSAYGPNITRSRPIANCPENVFASPSPSGCTWWHTVHDTPSCASGSATTAATVSAGSPPSFAVWCAIGAWLTLWMSYDWPLVVGGKPVGSVPPYVVIMFEMTILFGALSTILGIVFNAIFAARRTGTIQYDPRFTNDKFGIFVPAGSDKVAKVESLLREAGADEVRRG